MAGAEFRAPVGKRRHTPGKAGVQTENDGFRFFFRGNLRFWKRLCVCQNLMLGVMFRQCGSE